MEKYTFKGAKREEDGKYYDFEMSTSMTEVQPPTQTQPTDPATQPTPSDPGTTEPTPTTESAIPLDYYNSIFSSNIVVQSQSLARGQTIENKTITDTGHTASVIMMGNNTLRKTRIRSREGVRIAGSGEFRLEDFYIETTGTGSDHADGIQAYAPGSSGKLYLRRGIIVSHNTAATAGLFIADNYVPATVDCEDVVFQGGPFGLCLHADRGGNIEVYLRNTYFVGPFGYNPFKLLNYGGGRVVVRRWENVYNASISNGKLVKGTQIPNPQG